MFVRGGVGDSGAATISTGEAVVVELVVTEKCAAVPDRFVHTARSLR